MNKQEMFEAWKKDREQIDVSPDFSQRVMARLREGRAAPHAPGAASSSRLGRILARPWAKAAVVLLGVLAGLVRIAMTLDLILRA
jgi:hypothetical protein